MTKEGTLIKSLFISVGQSAAVVTLITRCWHSCDTTACYSLLSIGYKTTTKLHHCRSPAETGSRRAPDGAMEKDALTLIATITMGDTISSLQEGEDATY